MLALSGDVVIQTLGGVAVAGVTAWGAVAAARRSKRAQDGTAQVQAQLQPNGGLSLRDAVDRLETRTTEHDRRFGRIEAALDENTAILRRLEDRL